MAKISLGEGLFSDGPVEVYSENMESTFLLTPLTADVIAELERKGIKFNSTSTKQGIINARALMKHLVHGWYDLQDIKGNEIPFSDDNRDILAGVQELLAEIVELAKQLAVIVDEEDEKN